MLYAIIAEDEPDSGEARARARPQHLARLNGLKAEGRLLLAGPFPAIDCEDPGQAGVTGSLIVAEFESLQNASEWADRDPYVSAGVYHRVTVRPFRKVLP
ncbi:MAG: YciI family protein [Gammaproteobacteria bacterium]|jgi:hypothetical protein